MDDFFKKAILDCQESWRKVVAAAVTLGVPTPCFSTALAFFDGYRYVGVCVGVCVLLHTMNFDCL